MNSKLPPELIAKRDELAENYITTDRVVSNSYLESEEKGFVAGFNAGVVERDKFLASRGDEFDEHEAEQSSGDWLSSEGISFVSGARWQHQQDKLKYEAKVLKLEQQVHPDVIAINNELLKRQAIIEKLKEQISNDSKTIDELAKFGRIRTLQVDKLTQQRNDLVGHFNPAKKGIIANLDAELAEIEGKK